MEFINWIISDNGKGMKGRENKTIPDSSIGFYEVFLAWQAFLSSKTAAALEGKMYRVYSNSSGNNCRRNSDCLATSM